MLNKNIVIIIPVAQKLLTLVKTTPAREKIKHNKNMTKIVFIGLAEESLILNAIWSLLFLKGIFFLIIRKIISKIVSVMGSHKIIIGLNKARALSFEA